MKSRIWEIISDVTYDDGKYQIMYDGKYSKRRIYDYHYKFFRVLNYNDNWVATDRVRTDINVLLPTLDMP